MIERLLEIMRSKHLTSSQLADAIGVQRSGISHLLSGRNKPSLEFILKILSYYPDVNPDWLLFGKEPVLRDGPVNESKEGLSVAFSVPEVKHSDEGPASQQPSFLDDLFKEPGETPVFKKENTVENTSDTASAHHETPHDAQAGINPGGKSTGELPGIQQVIIENQGVEKIVVFYTNRRFREYSPE